MKKVIMVFMIALGSIIGLFVLLVITAMIMPHKPLIAEKEIVLEYNIKTIWDIVVNNSDYKWRTDITNIEIMNNGNSWTKYYDEAGNYFTEFTLTERREYEFYSFAMENKNFTGKWIGAFEKINENETRCIFTEKITVKNRIMNLLAKVFWNISKIQEQYISDLQNKLKG